MAYFTAPILERSKYLTKAIMRAGAGDRVGLAMANGARDRVGLAMANGARDRVGLAMA